MAAALIRCCACIDKRSPGEAASEFRIKRIAAGKTQRNRRRYGARSIGVKPRIRVPCKNIDKAAASVYNTITQSNTGSAML